MAVRLQTLNLNLLKVLDALFQERHVSRAGQALGLTQSAVSHALAQLRHLLSDPLFVRQGSAMAPTAMMLEIGPRLHAALSAMQVALTPQPFDPALTERCFTIATGDNVGAVLMPALVARLRSAAPAARIRILPLSLDVAGELEDGEIDCAINSFAAVPEACVVDALWREAPVWMARAAHPAVGRPIDAATLARLDQVVVDLSTGQRPASADGFIAQDGLAQWTSSTGLRDEAAPQRIVPAQRRAIVPSFFNAVALARESDLVTLLPRRLAEGVAPRPRSRAAGGRRPGARTHADGAMAWPSRRAARDHLAARGVAGLRAVAVGRTM